MSTINGLETQGNGSQRLREALLEFYGVPHQVHLQIKEMAPHLVDDALADVIEIKERIRMLEIKLRKLKT